MLKDYMPKSYLGKAAWLFISGIIGISTGCTLQPASLEKKLQQDQRNEELDAKFAYLSGTDKGLGYSKAEDPLYDNLPVGEYSGLDVNGNEFILSNQDSICELAFKENGNWYKLKDTLQKGFKDETDKFELKGGSATGRDIQMYARNRSMPTIKMNEKISDILPELKRQADEYKNSINPEHVQKYNKLIKN